MKYPASKQKYSARVLTSSENLLLLEEKERKKEEAEENQRKKEERALKRLAVAEEKEKKRLEKERKWLEREERVRLSAMKRRGAGSALKGMLLLDSGCGMTTSQFALNNHRAECAVWRCAP